MAEGRPVIELRGLAKSFGSLKAVDGISFTVGEGEIFAILGPNGAGKTTTVSMLCGLLLPSRGTATVAGFDVKKNPLEVRKSIGVVFQQPSVDDLLTGEENLEMHALLYGMPLEGRKERINEMLSLVGLARRKDSLLREYSGGMRKRLELARGILHRPKIMFLDEPTVGLDPQTRNHIWAYIRKMSRKENTTVVFTTHYLEEAEKFADRVAIIDHGKLIALGRPRELVEEIGGDTVVFGTRRPKELAAKLRKLGFVRDAKAGRGLVRAVLAQAQWNLPLLLRKIGGIESLRVQPATLNDVFIKYTGREIRDDSSAEGGFWERMANDRHSR